MGISNVHSSAAFALSGADPRIACAVVQWGLVNPWARVYELQPTHPLTALRIGMLDQDAAAAGQASAYPMPAHQDIVGVARFLSSCSCGQRHGFAVSF